jgi:hypothetical protein
MIDPITARKDRGDVYRHVTRDINEQTRIGRECGLFEQIQTELLLVYVT